MYMLPACAGVILDAFGWSHVRKYAPRMRGGDPYSEYDVEEMIQCSPHARG